ncbi:MAG: fatty acid desaturase [Gammaproteobacteria bacterium]|nr:fatty acid desaturase [Gammaproteobacteria bacterium]MDH5650384.1 fatty acid desaturase [Gammaproteobacteria bacterium]
MLKRFLSDPHFLFRYYLGNAGAFILALACLTAYSPWFDMALYWPWIVLLLPLALGGLVTVILCGLSYTILFFFMSRQPLHDWYILLPFLGILFGLYALAFVHLAGHHALGRNWLSRLIGELLSVPLLIGYPGWCVIHTLHHKHTDDPILDPHPTGEKDFLEFGGFMKKAMIDRIGDLYKKTFADRKHHRLEWEITKSLLVINRLLRAFFIFLLLNPLGFVLFYVPAFIAQTAFFIHFNWVTHRSTGDGRYQVLNIDKGIYYRVINTLLFGAYYHKNHHLLPGLFDPRNLDRNNGVE